MQQTLLLLASSGKISLDRGRILAGDLHKWASAVTEADGPDAAENDLSQAVVDMVEEITAEDSSEEEDIESDIIDRD